MTFQITVIICTHNPREELLDRTLEGLKKQTLPKSEWELLLVDNRSSTIISEKWNIEWHPNGSHIREAKLGLTPARLCGISEARGGLLVFVDDDNVLNKSYLQEALMISKKYTWVGAFGGAIEGEFEVEPEEHLTFMMEELAIKDVRDESWGCHPGISALSCAPCGAGLVIRSEIAQNYFQKVKNDQIRLSLDRKGDGLSSAGDSDMALCCCEVGLALGLFPQLRLTHLIPKERLEEKYLIQLAEGMSRSHAVLRYLWEGKKPHLETKISKSDQLFRHYKKFRISVSKNKTLKFQERIERARVSGILGASEIISNLE